MGELGDSERRKKWRLWTGGALAACAVVTGLAAFAVPFSDLTWGKAAAVIAALVIAAEVLAAAALLVLGKDFYRGLVDKLKSLRSLDDGR